MRLIVSILLIAILGFVSDFYSVWWSAAVVAFIICLVMKPGGGKSFLAGFLGIALMWFAVSFIADMRNEHILAERMSVLFFKAKNPVLFLIVAAVVGGLVGGFSGWAGNALGKALTKK